MIYSVEDSNIMDIGDMSSQGMFAPWLLAQSFTANRSYDLSKVRLHFIERAVQLTLSGGIYTLSGGRPDTLISSFTIKTPIGPGVGNAGITESILSSPASLTGSVGYAIVITGPASPDVVSWSHWGFTSDVYPPGVGMIYFNNVWSDNPFGRDFYFVTYSSVSLTPVPADLSSDIRLNTTLSWTLE